MWSHNYSPLPGVLPSAFLASAPILILLLLLGAFNVRAHRAAAVSLLCAVALAIAGFGMPLNLAIAAAGFGAMFGLFPIGWIVLNAMFVYQISVETGQFEALKQQIARISDDQRIQTLIIAFCFGAFIEGCAGFGAPVAITAAMLIGVGFKPLESATLALIGNTAPVAFGSVGIPITTLHSITGLDLHQLSAMTGRQLPFFSLLIPFWLVAVKAGFKGMLGVWPACLTCGVSFAVTQFAMSNYHGPWLVDTASALAAMFALGVLLRLRRGSYSKTKGDATLETTGVRLTPWLPWIFLSVFVAVWSIPDWKNWLNGMSSPKLAVPWIHLGIQKMPPAVPAPEAERAELVLNWLSATGTALLLAGVCSGFALRVSIREIMAIYVRTVLRLRVSLLTIVLMLALGFTTRYSGTDTAIGLAFAQTGRWFPFFSPLLGWLGVALTGSDTSSNVLFGNLQKTTAQQIDISPILTCAANTSGGVMGKMIDAQSIVVAGTATSGSGHEADAGTILRSVFIHSLVLAVLAGYWFGCRPTFSLGWCRLSFTRSVGGGRARSVRRRGGGARNEERLSGFRRRGVLDCLGETLFRGKQLLGVSKFNQGDSRKATYFFIFSLVSKPAQFQGVRMFPTLIAPSLLACDFGKLNEEVLRAQNAGADWLHLDVMDGHFVDNISFGPAFVSASAAVAKVPVDTHLMVSRPDHYFPRFVDSSANITIHVESLCDVGATLAEIRKSNCSCGLSLRPATPFEAVEPYLDEIDLLLVMTVEPGFGGQSFMPDMLEKVRRGLAVRSERRLSFRIEVDGGINQETAKQSIQAGADTLVAGTSLFKAADMAAAIRTMRGFGGRDRVRCESGRTG